MRSETEILLLEEIKEKKQSAQDLRSRAAGKRGGRVKFPTDLMSRKDKLKHTKAGKVTVTNIFDEILKRAEFDELEEHEQKSRLQYWRSKYSVKEIQKGMNIAAATYYNYIDSLDLPKQKKPRAAIATTPAKTKAIGKITDYIAAEQQPSLLEFEAEPQEPPAVKVETAPAFLELSGLNIAYNGSYSAEDIQKLFSKLDIILEGETSKFKIELKIMQE